MANTIIVIDGDKKKRKKGRRQNRTQSVEHSTEEISITNKKKNKNKNNRLNKTNESKTLDQTITDGESQQLKRPKNTTKTKVKKSIDIGTKKIIHDPKLIGALPSLPLFYQQIVAPVKDRHQYNEITKTVGWECIELLTKPTVLVLGTTEAGKTSLINYLLREKKGYEVYDNTIKDSKSSFIHLIYDDNLSQNRGSDSGPNKSWAYRDVTKFNKSKNECQLQLYQIRNNLLQEITFIDSPPITDSMLLNINQETTGFCPILINLIRKVDLIFFVGTSSIVDTQINKLISVLNPYNYKTIFCLNKSDQHQNLTALSNDRKNFSNYVTSSISNGEPKIICTYFKGTLPNDDMKDFIHNDMETLLSRIKKLPTTYKTSRLISLNIHMLEVIYNAYLQSDLRRKERRMQPKTLNAEEIGEINKLFNDLPYHDSFLKNFSTLPEEVILGCDKVKLKPTKTDDIDAFRSFLTNDFPYIQKVAEGEPESLVKFLLPLPDPNKDPEPPKKEKKKVIKEIKIAIPNEEEGDDDEEDDDNLKKKGSKDQDKMKKKQKFVKINKSMIDNMMKDSK